MDEEMAEEVTEAAFEAIVQALYILQQYGVKGYMSTCPVALMNLEGVDVQVQITITPNKSDWIGEDNVFIDSVFHYGDLTVN
jgi:hypothetical protein